MFKRSATATPSSPLPATPTSPRASSATPSFREVATVQAAAPLIPYDSSFQNENEKANLLLKRILVWDKLIDAVYPWVKQMQKVEANSAKSYAKLTPLIQFQDEVAAGTGDLAKSLDSLREFSTSVMSYHEQFSKYLKEQTLPKLDALQSEIKKHGKQMNKKIEKAGSKLKKCEEEAVSAMLAHQKICQEMKTTPNLTTVDPWLTEYRVKGKLAVLVAEHNQYKQRMLEVTEKIVGMDEQVARTIQDAFLQLAKWRAKQLTSLKADVDELGVAMSRIMPEADFQQYSNKTGLARHIEHWKQPGGVQAIDYPFRDTELAKVVRAGTLQRQGKVMKSRWHPAQCLLTHSAFLHCFDNYEAAQKDTENPLFSIDLKQCTIQLTSDDQASANCFEITSGNKDRWFLKASDEEAMVDWMIAMRKVKADMQALTNPPFSPEIVQQFAPVLASAASAAPPLPAKPSSTYDATPAPPTPASPPLTGEEEDFYNSALSSSAGGDVYQGGYLHESGDYYAQDDYHGGGGDEDHHQNYGGDGDGNNDQAW